MFAGSQDHLPAALQNLALPVIAAPMFIASGPELVLAQCKAGIVGAFPRVECASGGNAGYLAGQYAS
jgi:NAD(P)H-dependent flavin oxidoreductase YrpB (nitropropane dioxygenase family)